MNNYRGKRVDNGERVYGCLMHKWACGTEWSKYLAIQLAEDGNSHLVTPESVGQSTGLKDKNGVEIYGSIPINGVMTKGGDRVKATYCHLERESTIYEIVFDGDVACFAFHNKTNHCFRYEFRDGHELEVIGNQLEGDKNV